MHKHPTLRIAAGCLACLALSSIAQAALIAHWTFDSPENPGQDASGNGHHLELRGAVRTNLAKRGAGALDTHNGYAVAANTPELRLPGSFTIASWTRSENPGGNWMASVVCMNYAFVNDGWDYWVNPHSVEYQGFDVGFMDRAAGRTDIFVRSPVWGTSLNAVPATAAPDVWTHTALTYDAVSNIGTFYVNGVPVRSGTWDAPTRNSTAVLTVGTDHLQSNGTMHINGRDYLYGTIDDLRIYSHALSASQVAGLIPEVPEGVTLRISTSQVRIEMLSLTVGTSYQLETSLDAVAWTAVGDPFVAVETSRSQVIEVTATTQLFRVRLL